jgi:hypothetical protein
MSSREKSKSPKTQTVKTWNGACGRSPFHRAFPMVGDSLIQQRFLFCKSVLWIVLGKVDLPFQQVVLPRFALQDRNVFPLSEFFRGCVD